MKNSRCEQVSVANTANLNNWKTSMSTHALSTEAIMDGKSAIRDNYDLQSQRMPCG